jgi:lipoprotein-anchoring transpeptidase ErfK/SrfK
VLSNRRMLLAAAAASATLVVVGAAVAYDSSRDDLIAEGVTVAGVDVGGMRADEARAKIRRTLTGPLEQPVRVRVAGQRFRLTAKRAQIVADVEAMVDAAVDRSRDGWLPGRVWRGVTGARVDDDVPAAVDYSTVAVQRFVRRVRRAVNRPPRDAEVKFTVASLPAIPSQTGLKLVRQARLRRDVTAALTKVGRKRRVRAKVRVVQPDVTTDELGKKYPRVITVDRPSFRLRLFKGLRLAKTYKIAVGQVGLETPAGLYHVQNKAVNPAWHVPKREWAGALAGKVIPGGVPENPLKSRWLGIYDGAGIHGTADIGSLGTAASHGCIRMAIKDVEALYDQVEVQTPVFIH